MSVSKIEVNDFESDDWRFEFQKSIISASYEIDNVQSQLNLQSVPDVIFGSNECKLIYKPTGFTMSFNPQDSLRYCNYEFLKNNYFEYTYDHEITDKIMGTNVIPSEIQLKFAEHWKNKDLSEIDVKVLDKLSDTFYSTPYKGTVTSCKLQNTTEDINIANLTEKNTIVFSDMVHLWEDELDDNGLTLLEFRFRSMKDCFFGLLRHYIRVDDVLIRIYDTRIYHEYGKDYILREFSVRENTYDELKNKNFMFNSEFFSDGHS